MKLGFLISLKVEYKWKLVVSYVIVDVNYIFNFVIGKINIDKRLFDENIIF